MSFMQMVIDTWFYFLYFARIHVKRRRWSEGVSEVGVLVLPGGRVDSRIPSSHATQL
jgi:hypothetical protein